MLLTVYNVCFFICLADLEFTNTKLVLLFKLTLTRNMMSSIGLKKISYVREKTLLDFQVIKLYYWFIFRSIFECVF